MKTGINQWAFPNAMPAIEAMTLAKNTGFTAFEICIGDDGPVRLDASDEELTAIRRHADKLGLKISSVGSCLGWTNPLCSPDPVVRQKSVETFSRLLQMSHTLGAEVLLTVPGGVTPEIRYDLALENALASIQDLAPIAEKCNVCIGIENVWNKFLLSPVEMRDFIDQFQSPCVGAFFDIGNIILYGYPEQWIQILGRRIRMVHAKDFRASVGTLSGFVMLLEGDVNWPAVMAAFRETGYDGALVAEYGPYPYSLDATLRHVHASLNAIVSL